MTRTDAALMIFTGFNLFRVVAYVPQIVLIGRDRNGAAAVSCTSWLMFALSHVSTVAYALVVVGDVAMAVAFTANALCCFAVVGMTAYKRGWVTLAPSAVTPVGGMGGSAYLPEAAGLKVEGDRTSKWPLSGSMWLKTCSSSLVRTLAGR